MLPVFASAVSGLQASQQTMDITANNIANANTPGFDAADPTIEDLLYQRTDARSLVTSASTTAVGVGTRLEGAPRSLVPGAPIMTGNPLDVAITGDGYIPVQQPDGTTGYTRSGTIRLDGQGRFTINGQIVQPALTMPSGASNPFIDNNGQVTVTTPNGPQVLGQLQLARFPNPQGLQAVGSTVFTVTGASGQPITGIPGNPGFGHLQPGAIEAARVDLSKEMSNLIIAERAYGLNAKALQTLDTMIGAVAQGR